MPSSVTSTTGSPPQQTFRTLARYQSTSPARWMVGVVIITIESGLSVSSVSCEASPRFSLPAAPSMRSGSQTHWPVSQRVGLAQTPQPIRVPQPSSTGPHETLSSSHVIGEQPWTPQVPLGLQIALGPGHGSPHPSRHPLATSLAISSVQVSPQRCCVAPHAGPASRGPPSRGPASTAPPSGPASASTGPASMPPSRVSSPPSREPASVAGGGAGSHASASAPTVSASTSERCAARIRSSPGRASCRRWGSRCSRRCRRRVRWRCRSSPAGRRARRRRPRSAPR